MVPENPGGNNPSVRALMRIELPRPLEPVADALTTPNAGQAEKMMRKTNWGWITRNAMAEGRAGSTGAPRLKALSEGVRKALAAATAPQRPAAPRLQFDSFEPRVLMSGDGNHAPVLVSRINNRPSAGDSAATKSDPSAAIRGGAQSVDGNRCFTLASPLRSSTSAIQSFAR